MARASSTVKSIHVWYTDKLRGMSPKILTLAAGKI